MRPDDVQHLTDLRDAIQEWLVESLPALVDRDVALRVGNQAVLLRDRLDGLIVRGRERPEQRLSVRGPDAV